MNGIENVIASKEEFCLQRIGEGGLEINQAALNSDSSAIESGAAESSSSSSSEANQELTLGQYHNRASNDIQSQKIEIYRGELEGLYHEIVGMKNEVNKQNEERDRRDEERDKKIEEMNKKIEEVRKEIANLTAMFKEFLAKK
jgi:predicted RNase H-like nuclease (RuvC/YqgF family)